MNRRDPGCVRGSSGTAHLPELLGVQGRLSTVEEEEEEEEGNILEEHQRIFNRSPARPAARHPLGAISR